MPRRLSFDVVEGSGWIYGRSMAGEPGSGLSGANDDDSVLVAVVGWHGDVRERAGGPCRARGTECARRQIRACAEGNDTAGLAGVGACGWRTGCREGLR